MKKSQLRKIIRESIREMVEEKQMLNEIEGCHFSFSSGECGPSYCTTTEMWGGGQDCVCRTFQPGSDDCDQSNTGGSIGVSSDLGGMSKGTGMGGGTDVKKPNDKKYSMKEIEAGDIEPILPSTDKEEKWCTCRYHRCLRDNTQTSSTLSWGGCTGSGACGCMGSKLKSPSKSTKL